MTLIMPTTAGRGRASANAPDPMASAGGPKKKKRDRDKVKKDKEKEAASSLMVACLKRLLPVGLNLFAGREQELVQHAKEKLLSKDNADMAEFVKTQLTLPDKIDPNDAMGWQHQLYSKLGTKRDDQVGVALDQLAERIVAMATVLHGLHVIDHPQLQAKGQYHSVVSSQRKRAVIACFRQTSLHSMTRHAAINLFLRTYKELWLNEENIGQEMLIEDLTQTFEDAELKKKEEEEASDKHDPLTQLVTAFCRNATTEQSGAMQESTLYMVYAEIFAKSCGEEAEEEEGGDEEGPSIHEQEMEKQKLLFQQTRLADRGAAEMVLLYISACKGVPSDMVMNTLNLGISILRGGNVDVQGRMLQHLKDKKDVGFFTSISGLMNASSVLDLDGFERNLKVQGLGVGPDGGSGDQNMADSEFTCALFRMLQLLCEGHNLEFQNYLRTQAGNTTTVNVVICVVDYLLRLQESIMDFYWHYSSKEVIDASGQSNFLKAIGVASQVFNTLTEFIQGPCTLNQQTLAHSRLWDAVVGFLFLFANMQDKLSKHASQLELLMELLNLQKDMVIMMLSMLEGNVVNGTIGKQMVDTLVESASNVEMILKFFDIFLKLQDIATSAGIQELDPKKTGWVTPREFQKAMEQTKNYSQEEISYIISCLDCNMDDKFDYFDFTERFHNPAKEIGFNLAVLLTNLSEHMPSDVRLQRFLETAGSVLNYFEPFLGRIEIMGSANRIERVYFEIKDSNIEQWEKPQIKESKRAFFYSIVTEGGDKEKLELFVSFCEDAIFEMQHASSLTDEEVEDLTANRTAAYSYVSEEDQPKSAFDPVKQALILVKNLIVGFLSNFTPANLKRKYAEMQEKTPQELLKGFFHMIFYNCYFCSWCGYWVLRTVGRFLMYLMGGYHMKKLEDELGEPAEEAPAETLTLEVAPPPQLAIADAEANGPITAFGVDITKEADESGDVKYNMAAHPPTPELSPQSSFEGEEPSPPVSEGEELPSPDKAQANGKVIDGAAIPVSEVPAIEPAAPPEGAKAAAAPAPAPAEPEAPASVSGAVSRINFAGIAHKVVSFLSRNFYNFNYLALVLAFTINFILLFYKVSTVESDDEDEEAVADLLEGSGAGIGSGLGAIIEDVIEALNGTGDGDDGGESGGGSGFGENGEEEEDPEEWITMKEKVYYLEPVIRALAIIHSLVSLCMLIAYYNLKVPLGLFKREKEIARSLEFDGMWIAEQPAEDDLMKHWDKLVISTKSFPVNYWDKFVKKKVRQKYSETYDFEAISNLLGMEKGGLFGQKEEASGIIGFLTSIDWKYQIWKVGVTFTDNSFLYIVWYFSFSVLGNFNYFFFSAHLLDLAVAIKSLRTILQSVTHNGKQLLLTVMLLTIIVYIYTVIAFNFFRKFYVQEEDDQVDMKCHDMLTCFTFHLYKGVRAGGGIGDEIESPDGDDYEVYRILFDITFFFFIIVILLAIIQGLIIDAFGELRDQLESVKEDMESNCFICGMGKDYFDSVPHGFDTHCAKEHNLANYMFFLMHLINKPDTEYTGQETYVWEKYQQRSWDFFPVGDCFRKHYEEELSGGGGGGGGG